MQKQEPERRLSTGKPAASHGHDCLQCLIDRYGQERIDTLARLIRLTSSVEYSLRYPPNVR